jgi:hypothetical protein
MYRRVSQHIVKNFQFYEGYLRPNKFNRRPKKYAHQCLKYTGAQFLVGN